MEGIGMLLLVVGISVAFAIVINLLVKPRKNMGETEAKIAEGIDKGLEIAETAVPVGRILLDMMMPAPALPDTSGMTEEEKADTLNDYLKKKEDREKSLGYFNAIGNAVISTNRAKKDIYANMTEDERTDPQKRHAAAKEHALKITDETCEAFGIQKPDNFTGTVRDMAINLTLDLIDKKKEQPDITFIPLSNGQNAGDKDGVFRTP